MQKKSVRRGLKITGMCLAGFLILICSCMTHPKFGKRPSGERLELIKKSPNYREGKFRNQNETPQMTESIGKVLAKNIFKKSATVKPQKEIPVLTPDWQKIDRNENLLIWLGHSSYFIQLDGKRILVDPVFSKSISPLPFGGKPFNGTGIFDVANLPAIDFLLITHDHYDHLDYETIIALQPKTSIVVCGLGVGEHLEHWGYSPDVIREKDWYDQVDLGNDFFITLTPARHFSGRSIWHSNTLWTSYVLQTPNFKFYIGGDSGYDMHFKEIGEKYGPFDLAILENGQYDQGWKHIHMFPEEVWQAANELGAKALLPVHSSKFALANHAWDEPLERIFKAASNSPGDSIKLFTPLIGQQINLSDTTNWQFSTWWKDGQ